MATGELWPNVIIVYAAMGHVSYWMRWIWWFCPGWF